jgi:ATP-dependent DNA helicase RecQ
MTVPALEAAVNLRRGRLESLLKVLDVEGAVERRGSAWSRTGQPWIYDSERLAKVDAARRSEQDAMVAYAATPTCRMRFLREALDDPEAADCGRCDRCTGVSRDRELPVERVRAALAHLRTADVVIDPRKQWPRGTTARKGNIAAGARVEQGRALAYGTDAGWFDVVSVALEADGPVTDEIVGGLVGVLKRWPWEQRPTWVTWVPSRSHPELVRSVAERIASLGKMALVDGVRRVRSDAPPQRRMENSLRQFENVVDAFQVQVPDLPSGPVLLVDDTVSSGWTMTLVGEALRSAGADAVLPLALWRRP